MGRVGSLRKLVNRLAAARAAQAPTRENILDAAIVGAHRTGVLEDRRSGALPASRRSAFMTETLTALQKRMAAAADAMNFEEARALRDRINLMRGGATSDDAANADTSGLQRQQPGAMGLGTSQQRVTPPPGWERPRKPDPMTARTGRRRGK